MNATENTGNDTATVTPQTSARNWAWTARQAGLGSGKVSVLAVLETAIATLAGLWAWSHWGLYPLMLTSLVVAFLTMLRSPESIAAGLKSWRAYGAAWEAVEKPEGKHAYLWLALAFTLGFALTAWIADLDWFHSHQSKASSAAAIYIAVTSMVAALFGALSANFINVGVLAWLGSISGITLAIAVLPHLWYVSFPAGYYAGAALLSLFTSALATITGGIPLRAFGTRVYFTSLNLPQGIKCFAQNWRTLVLTTDLTVSPNPLPGLKPGDFLAFQTIEKNPLKWDHSGAWLLAPALITLLYAPTYLFRLTLKSTFWAYWPLLLITQTPKGLRDARGRIIWDRAYGKSLEDLIAFVISAAALAMLAVRLFDAGQLRAVTTLADAHDKPIYWPVYLTGLDWTRLTLWDAFPAIGAALSIAALMMARRLHRQADRQPPQMPTPDQLQLLYSVCKLRNWAAYATILLGISTAVWALHHTCQLPALGQPFLTWLIGAPQHCG